MSNTDEVVTSISLEELPIEILVEIFSFLNFRNYASTKFYLTHSTFLKALKVNYLWYLYWQSSLGKHTKMKYDEKCDYHRKMKKIEERRISLYWEKRIEKKLSESPISMNSEIVSQKKKWVHRLIKIDFDRNLMVLFNQKTKKKMDPFNLKECKFYDSTEAKSRRNTLRIEENNDNRTNKAKSKKKTKPRVIYLSIDTLTRFDELKIELEECFGEFMGDEMKSPGMISKMFGRLKKVKDNDKRLRIEVLPVSKWTKKDVLTWLREIKQWEKREGFINNNVNGAILIEMDKVLLKNIGIAENMYSDEGLFLAHSNILDEIDFLKANGSYSGSFSRDRFKLKVKLRRTFGKDEDEHINIVQALKKEIGLRSLTIPTFFMNKFLSTSSFSTKLELFKIGYYSRRGGVPIDEDVNLRPFYEGDDYYERRVRFRVGLKEVDPSTPERNKTKLFRRTFATHNNNSYYINLKSKKPCEMFLVPVIEIGCWTLTWNEAGLLIPKRATKTDDFRNRSPPFVFATYIPSEYSRDITRMIAGVCCEYNVNYSFFRNEEKGGETTTKKEEHEKTPLDLLFDLVDVFGIKLPPSVSHWKKGNNSGSYKGYIRPKVHFSKDFMEYFSIKFTEFEVESHLLLDEFCSRLKHECLDVANCFLHEWNQLMCIDRLMWVRHCKFPDDPLFAPRLPPENSCSGCAFGDPRQTFGYM